MKLNQSAFGVEEVRLERKTNVHCSLVQMLTCYLKLVYLWILEFSSPIKRVLFLFIPQKT